MDWKIHSFGYYGKPFSIFKLIAVGYRNHRSSYYLKINVLAIDVFLETKREIH